MPGIILSALHVLYVSESDCHEKRKPFKTRCPGHQQGDFAQTNLSVDRAHLGLFSDAIVDTESGWVSVALVSKADHIIATFCCNQLPGMVLNSTWNKGTARESRWT